MTIHINELHKRCSETKSPMQNQKNDEAIINMVLVVEKKTKTQNWLGEILFVSNSNVDECVKHSSKG